jgi:hypothetical protein
MISDRSIEVIKKFEEKFPVFKNYYDKETCEFIFISNEEDESIPMWLAELVIDEDINCDDGYKIMRCIVEFDFNQVKKYMSDTDHKWYYDSKDQVPTIEVIKNRVFKLLKDASMKKNTSISCGGFNVVHLTENNNSGFELYYSIIESMCWDNPYKD